jgi:hypothetical protein
MRRRIRRRRRRRRSNSYSQMYPSSVQPSFLVQGSRFRI